MTANLTQLHSLYIIYKNEVKHQMRLLITIRAIGRSLSNLRNVVFYVRSAHVKFKNPNISKVKYE